MRLLLVILAVLYSAGVSASTFAERVALAKEIESQRAASDYFFKQFFPTVGPSMGGIMKECLSHSDASQEKFTVVANITQTGALVDVDFEPKSNNTAACFAKGIAALVAPPPPLCDCGVLPVVIDMKVAP